MAQSLWWLFHWQNYLGILGIWSLLWEDWITKFIFTVGRGQERYPTLNLSLPIFQHKISSEHLKHAGFLFLCFQFLHACDLKAHTDWIRSLDFSLPICNDEANSILLVSSSQDKGIRIWKMTLRGSLTSKQGTYRKEEISLASYIEGPVFVAGSSSYQISLESLLIGHEDWVYSVEWQPPSTTSVEGTTYHQPQSILSASMDKTMMIWQPERTTGIWMNVVTVGELSHSALGFYGGHWSPDGNAILAHGYGGAFHLWKNVGVDVDHWQPQKVPSGHFAAVTDIAWARSGEYMVTVSHDQVMLCS